ncbi:MAG: helix-turn-helix transcriptional regulator [Bacilli bacterium]|mgnify:FL=1|nr:helix-turn-helix transcriptional regulator [Bacillota bacterium]NLI52332.1 helix-turn-helix transcriptional regulator [Erysipelotrichaceae bacterium]OQC49837.1 MAG: helix-turn-helix protein [Tenericutes bacterium ADurb.Bin024]HOA10997.1 helix-turn-helix transcriptional regulator [Bacilli bacterium]HPY79124.1 helix-turn-helix transcriptional regulator [Bacilli bacterium]
MTISEKIKKLRKAQGHTQAELAKGVNVSRTLINKYENGAATPTDGNFISPYAVVSKNGLKYTDLSRTITDAFANEEILDMQGITEAISRYYFTNNEKLDGIAVAPEYQERFERLVSDAIEYHEE